jgi:hypothetical protein
MIIDFKNDCITYFAENFQAKVHKPFSTSFSEIEVLKDGRIIVIEDYYEFKFETQSNAYCLNRELEIDWFLPLPHPAQDPDDVYVGFTTNGEKVFANTWACFRVEIDIETGALKSVEFTK